MIVKDKGPVRFILQDGQTVTTSIHWTVNSPNQIVLFEYKSDEYKLTIKGASKVRRDWVWAIYDEYESIEKLNSNSNDLTKEFIQALRNTVHVEISSPYAPTLSVEVTDVLNFEPYVYQMQMFVGDALCRLTTTDGNVIHQEHTRWDRQRPVFEYKNEVFLADKPLSDPDFLHSIKRVERKVLLKKTVRLLLDD